VDNSTCVGLQCRINYEGTRINAVAVVDPCSESVAVTATDSASGEQVFHNVFSQSSAMDIDVGGLSPTLYVLINHYTYSMTVAVSDS
jgi:hypothetical protein